ncbi:MAG: phage head-tail connector protein [Hyphomicrobiales bacterium]
MSGGCRKAVTLSARCVAPPAEEPVSLAEARAHLRLFHGDEDDVLARLIVAARRQVETRSGLLLIRQGWTVQLEHWPGDGEIRLPLRPLIAVESVSVGGGMIDAALYESGLETGRLRFIAAATPPAGTVTIAVTAGFGMAGDVPADIRQALLIILAQLYEHRGTGDAPAPPLTVAALLAPYREPRL